MQQQRGIKDLANMKLFGKTIKDLVVDSVSSGGDDCEEIDSSALDHPSPMILKLNSVRGNLIEDPMTGHPNDTEQQVGIPQASKEDSAANPPMDEENDHNDTTVSKNKQVKRPDKLLPCPRCKSMDTKFCYYNNYNVLQPRHFCKSCQRYWTSGGTMRNVPVGAGRRRNRTGASLPCHLAIPEALTSARDEESNVVRGLCPSLNYMNGTVQVVNGEDLSTGSSVTVTNSTEEMGNNCVPFPSFMPNFGGYAPHFQYMPPGFHWPYQWNPQALPPPFFHPGMPMPFYHPAYMSAPWSTCPTNYYPNPQTTPDPTTLGKHSRDCEESPAVQKRLDSSVCVPKTLRSDDPKDAAKSSIWKTLGIENNSISTGGIFKAFRPNNAEKTHDLQSSPLLLANPAALSRSVSFRESL